jgi:hypothetical protein
MSGFGKQCANVVWLCVLRRLARSVGDSPTRGKARPPVAAMAGRREIKALKPIDKAILGW